MKFAMSTMLVAAAFVFIIFISLYGGSKNFQPYSFGNQNMLQGHPYEGFGPMLEYTTYPTNAAIDSTHASDNAVAADRTRLRGFDGLFGASSVDDSSLDVYSKADGQGDCKSYGLMNSKGFLCLDSNQVGLLTSRGGNASGR